MMKIENQIPRFDIIRKNFESRYYAVDAELSGRMRFAYGISNDEAVFKDGTYSKCAEHANVGDISFKIVNDIIGIDRNSYLQIKDKFYLVNYVENNTIYLYNSLETELNAGDIIRLFSNEVFIDNSGTCTELEFKSGTTFKHGNFSYFITDEDTIDSVVAILSKQVLVTNFGTTIYAIGDWSSTLSYFKVYNEYPIKSGFLNIRSNDYVVAGDNLVLFNEDIRANNTIAVKELDEQESATGYYYVSIVTGLNGKFKYGQLRAFPAYISKKINIQNLKPSILDVCDGTVYGNKVNIIKGFRKFNLDEEITDGFENLQSVTELNTEPADLWINEVLSGKIEPILPNLVFITDKDGLFRMYVDSKVDTEFVFRFTSKYADFKVSITDVNGQMIVLGKSGDYIKSHLNKVTINIKSNAGDEVLFDTFKVVSQRCTHIQYYFVCPETSNERIEVNGLHLNPIFRNYRELLAVIGRDKVGEGRISL